MFSKLAIKNVTKSLRDYTVYFLTLMFGVCLFYMFNSIDSQTAMLSLTESKMKTVRTLMQAINYISAFVSVVLGFLVVYANRFLIRRRKQEFGVYMTLGMPRGTISAMIVLETLLIGIFSLAAGLVAGVFAAQGMSVLTAKLFETSLKAFRFAFSQSAFEKTLLYFTVIFLVVMIFNTVSVSRLKLIRLLNGSRENEKISFHRPWASIVSFILAAAALITAYMLVIRNGIQPNQKFAASLVLGCVGTLLFFFSLSGFLLWAMQGSKKHYWKNLNMFVFRQFSSKINTTFVSVSVICLMLFLTISALAVGTGVSGALSKELRFTTPYDISFLDSGETSADGEQTSAAVDIAAQMKQNSINLSHWAADYAQIFEYTLSSGEEGKTDIPISQGDYTPGDWQGQRVELFRNSATVISVSDFNRAMKVQGKTGVTLPEGRFLMNCNVPEYQSVCNSFLAKGGRLIYKGRTLRAGASEIFNNCLANASGPSDCGTVIVPDSFLRGLGLRPSHVSLNIRYKPGANEKELLKAYQNIPRNHDESHSWGYQSKKAEYESAANEKTLTSYMTLYFGLVFLIAAAAVLALQQLSEASDNAERYGLLRKLGAEESMVSQALFKQVALYFTFPLSLAVIHSAVAIYVVNTKVMAGGMNILDGVLMAAAFFLVVYGAYFLATYFGSKSMIRQRGTYHRAE